MGETSVEDPHRYAREVDRTATALIRLMRSDERWQGACHALSAVGYVLLREQRVPVVPCLGEVRVGDAITDHSWLEVCGLPLDIAIANPLDARVAVAPVVAGQHLDDLRPSEVVYGVTSGRDLDLTATKILSMTLGQYMDGFPDHVDGLWGIAVDLGATFDLRMKVDDLRSTYGRHRWSLRPSEKQRTLSAEERRRARNQRKQDARRRR